MFEHVTLQCPDCRTSHVREQATATPRQVYSIVCTCGALWDVVRTPSNTGGVVETQYQRVATLPLAVRRVRNAI